MNLIFLIVILMHIGVWQPVDLISTTTSNIRWQHTKWEKMHGALLYNPETEQLHDKISKNGSTNCFPCITACPAETLGDKHIIKKYSRSKNSVFLKHVYKEFSPGDVQTEICDTLFEPAILFDQTTFTFETGYELYYSEDDDVDLKFNEYSYDNFLSISMVTSKLKKLEPSRIEKIFEVEYQKPRVFYWIPVLSLKFDAIKYQIRASFKKDAITNYRDIKLEKCSQYDLGSSIYKKTLSAKFVNFFNSENNRLGIFDELYVPIEIKPDPASNESPYLHSYGGLERAPLVPLMFFHTGAAKNATCTVMNTIPIWTSILRGHLKRIDNYLYTIYRMWQSKVDIIFGVSGISKVKVPDNWKMEGNKFEVKKDPEPFDVAYPKIIYRVIEYGTGTPEEKSYALIIIHNDRTATKKDKLCENPNDDWMFINNDDPKTGISYVCPLDRNIAEELGVYSSLPENVNAFQLFNMNPGEKLKGTDERERIKVEMRRLFPDMQMPAEDVRMCTNDTDFASMTTDETEVEAQPEFWLESKNETQKQPESTYEYPNDHRFWIIEETIGVDL